LIRTEKAISYLSISYLYLSRTNEPYTLEIDGNLVNGTTDEHGRIEEPIPPDARRGVLLVGEPPDEHILNLGHIDPIEEISGVQECRNRYTELVKGNQSTALARDMGFPWRPFGIIRTTAGFGRTNARCLVCFQVIVSPFLRPRRELLRARRRQGIVFDAIWRLWS
jgi:hypothetical protein